MSEIIAEAIVNTLFDTLLVYFHKQTIDRNG